MPAAHITRASIEDNRLRLTWSDGERHELPAACLRHSPGFPGGQRPAGRDGRFPTQALQPAAAQLTEGGELSLQWQPGDVTSSHGCEWLRELGTRLSAAGEIDLKTWDARQAEGFRTYSYPELAREPAARMSLFDQVLDRGVALMKEVPDDREMVREIAGWFGLSPPNPYADDANDPTLSSIRVDPSVRVATNMSHFLGPHTDTCWRQSLIGLLLMHCIESHPQGGRSIVVDGFAVAERLRSLDGKAFEFLSSVPLNFDAIVSPEDRWYAKGRVISLGADGVIEGIRYNGNSIGQLWLPAGLIESAYEALEAFERVLYDSSLWWQPLLQPGDLMILDNHRVLHGRHEFDPGAGARLIRCCGVDRDDFHNRYRRFAKALGSPGWDRRLSSGVC